MTKDPNDTDTPRRGSNSTPPPPPSPFAIAVNGELRAWAARRRISQRRLSEMTGIPRATLGRMVWTDRKPLTVHYLRIICAALDVSPVDIVAAADRATAALEAPETVTQDGYTLAARRAGDPDVSEADYL